MIIVYNNLQDNNQKFNISSDDFIDIMGNEKWSESELVEFAIKFNGKAVESNEMDIDELATSLLGISDVLVGANALIHGSYSKMLVKVRSSFRPGSFIVDIASFFTSDGIQALVNITSLVGLMGGTGTLIWLFKHTNGKKILTKKKVEGNNYEITVKDSENPIIVNGDVISLYESASIRQGLIKLVHPLENEGISDITFLKNEKECEKILRDERGCFSPLDNESTESKEDVDYFLITQSNFEGKQTGWRVSFGDSAISTYITDDFAVKILDEDFLEKVKNQEIIISNEGTTIRAQYKKTIQRLERLSVKWEILNVLEIYSGTCK